jgi:hypothetical protein
MTHAHRSIRRTAHAGLAASMSLLCGVAAAQADDPNPYYIGLSQAFTRDSNIFRVPDGPGDTYSSTGIVGGFDQPIGRQRVYANANVRNNRFNDLDQLNNVSYGVNGGLDWSAMDKLSGNLTVFSNRNLANYSAAIDEQVARRNVETTDQVMARVQYGMAGLLSIDGGVAHRRLDYSDDAFAASRFRQNSIFAGLKYRPSGALTLGVGLRGTKGRYPSIDVDFDRSDVDFTATWIATGQSTVNARLSASRQDNKGGGFDTRDFSGATGFLGWDYKPTGKLSFRTAISRDTGTETSFLRLTEDAPQSVAFGDTARLTNALTVNGKYDATAKIAVTAAGKYAKRDLANTTVGSPTTTGSDRFGSITLGLSYAPTRSWLLGCSVGYEKRGSRGGLSTSFEADTASCSAQFVIR